MFSIVFMTFSSGCAIDDREIDTAIRRIDDIVRAAAHQVVPGAMPMVRVRAASSVASALSFCLMNKARRADRLSLTSSGPVLLVWPTMSMQILALLACLAIWRSHMPYAVVRRGSAQNSVLPGLKRNFTLRFFCASP